MKAKEYLQRPAQLKAEIQADIDRLADMRSIAECITRQLSFTAGRVLSKDPYSFEKAMIDITAEEESIWKKAEILRDMEIEILKMIQKLPKTSHQTVLRLRYLTDMKWKDIAEKMYVSDAQIYRLHNDALKAFEKLIVGESF